ncbi:hypothetical protein EC973_000067 [Apophysomyces ossiformis]|uniref:Uncharacterized protein n=1 Tax=Apophysomyces ossiformis TaxID=679940 RepID=A0A8H7BTY8_9FUNG|nr:hypothetical protein EC973_000067 [Apophysomyces ossiformis]
MSVQATVALFNKRSSISSIVSPPNSRRHSRVNDRADGKPYDFKYPSSGCAVASMVNRFSGQFDRISINRACTSPTPNKTERRCTPSDNGRLERTTTLDTAIDELLAMHQALLDQCSAAEKRVRPLEAQLAASLQVKEYLTKKLQQVSGERDNLERQLSMYRHDQIDTPTSPESNPYSDYFSFNAEQPQQHGELKRRNTLGSVSATHHRSQEAATATTTCNTSANDQIQIEKQLMDYITAYERDTQRMVQSYMSELEAQRSKTRMLRDVIDKQDSLIGVYETMLRTSRRQDNEAANAAKKRKAYSVNASDELLKAQVELQRLELEDKQQLLSILLREREDLMKKVNEKDQPHDKDVSATRPALRRKRSLSHPASRSSIEILATIARPTSSSCSPEKAEKRSSSPPTGPPRDPLPPVPSLPSVPSRRSSPVVPDMSYSTTPSSSYTSLTTAEFEQETTTHHPQPIRIKRHSDPRSITSNEVPSAPEKFWKCTGGITQRRSSKRFWKGLKHIFGAS